MIIDKKNDNCTTNTHNWLLDFLWTYKQTNLSLSMCHNGFYLA